MKIPNIMHGTHEQNFGRRPENLTEFATSVGYRAFDIYHVAKFGIDLAKTGINRSELFLQIKGRELRDSSFSYNPKHSIPSIEYPLSLSLLNTNYIDVQMISFINDDLSISDKTIEKWKKLETVYRSEKLNYIGVEHISTAILKELVNISSIKPSFIHSGCSDAESSRYTLENAIVCQAYGMSTILKPAVIIAPKYNVTAMQVMFKFAIQMGVQVLTGGNSEAHVKENALVDFELNSEEMKQIISAKRDSEEYLSIYEDLQNKTLMKLEDIVTKFSNCSEDEIPALLAKIGHYIAKLDPTSLAKIITAQTPMIINYLQEYGANFAEITSNSYAEIINAHGFKFINELKDKLQVAPEKLLLSSLNSPYFSELFKQSDLKKLYKNEVLQIIKTYPNTIENFISASIAPEILLIAFSFTKDKKSFDDLLNKCDLNQLNNLDIVKIITSFGNPAVSQLYNNGINFEILTSKDLEILINLHGIEMARSLTYVNASAGLLVPAMKLGGVELFNELVSQAKLSDFQNIRLIKEIVQYHPENLAQLIKHGVSIGCLIYSVKSNSNMIQNIFNVLLSSESLPSTAYDEFFSYGGIDLLPVSLKNIALYKNLIDKLDPLEMSTHFTKALNIGNNHLIKAVTNKLDLLIINSYERESLLLKTIDSGNNEIINIIAGKLDPLTTIKLPYQILLKAMDTNNDSLIKIITNKVDLSEISLYSLKDVLIKAIDINNDNLINISANNLDFLNIPDSWQKEILLKVINTGDDSLVKIVTNKINFVELHDSYKIKILLNSIDSYNSKLHDMPIEGLTSSNLTNKEVEDIFNEINNASSEKKQEFAEQLYICAANKECLNECFTEVLPSYIECYGSSASMNMEL